MPKLTLICDYCDELFERYPSQIGEKSNYCSKACFNADWTSKSIGWTDPDGRKTICVEGKEILEHRYIMEQHLQRDLKPYELVHHDNGDPSDNRLENLQIMTRSAHTILHNTGKSRKGQKRKPVTEETKARISAAKLGNVLSEDHKQRISETMKRVRKEKFWSSRRQKAVA